MSTPRAQEYDVQSQYDNPQTWPDEGEFRNLVDYLRASTGCAGITIHSTTDGRQHATYYGKGDFVGGGVLREIRENGYTVTLAGHGPLPSQTSHTSWIADGYDGDASSYIEFKPTAYVEQL